MARLPVLSGQEMVKILQKMGFEVVRRKGGHVSMRKGEYRTVIPIHVELARGTLLGILRQCGIGKEELINFLKG